MVQESTARVEVHVLMQMHTPPRHHPTQAYPVHPATSFKRLPAVCGPGVGFFAARSLRFPGGEDMSRRLGLGVWTPAAATLSMLIPAVVDINGVGSSVTVFGFWLKIVAWSRRP